MVNNIKNNTISEIDAKKDLNKLNEIKNVEIIKYKKRTPGHKKLLNLFNDLSDIILTDKTLESESQENENENEKVDSKKEENEDKDYENENEYENEGDDYKNGNEDEYESENEDEIIKILMHSHEYAEIVDQNEKDIMIKKLNDYLDKIIDKPKSFEEQIELLEKVEYLEEYYFIDDFDDKELESKIFKLKLAHLPNIIDKKLFEQIFGHTIVKLTDKLINTTNKEENQILVKNIEKSKDKLFEMDNCNDWVVQPSVRCINLIDAINLVLNFNKDQLDLV